MRFKYEIKDPDQFLCTSICQEIDAAGEKIMTLTYYNMSSVLRVTFLRHKSTAARKISSFFRHVADYITILFMITI